MFYCLLFFQIFTDIQPKSPPPKPVAWWIILVSVLAGLILIAVIVLILWKVRLYLKYNPFHRSS